MNIDLKRQFNYFCKKDKSENNFINLASFNILLGYDVYFHLYVVHSKSNFTVILTVEYQAFSCDIATEK